MREVIACCSCGNVPDYTKESFGLLFPDKETPTIYKGINEIRRFAEKMSPDFNISKYLLALARSKNKYSYYFEYNEETGEVISQWDILKGRKVA